MSNNAGIGHNSSAGDDVLNVTAQTRLRTIVERIQRLQEDRDNVNADIKEVLAEAKGEGFNCAIIRKIVRFQRQDKAKRDEESALMDLYLSALGLL